MKKNSGNLFLGIIGVSTLIVAIIGATFAYFSATAGSNEDAIQTTGTVLNLGWYEDTSKMGSDLIPVEDHIAIFGATDDEYIAEDPDTHVSTQCVDDNGNNICSIFDFGVTNEGNANQDIFGKITIQSNTFKNLRFAIYRLNDDGTQIVNPDGTREDETDASEITPVIKATYFDDGMGTTAGTYNTGSAFAGLYNQAYDTHATFNVDGNILSLATANTAGQTTTYSGLYATLLGKTETTTDGVKYRLIMWIHETGRDQTSEDGKIGEGEADVATFIAGVTFTTSLDGTTGVTGIISKSSKLNSLNQGTED